MTKLDLTGRGGWKVVDECHLIKAGISGDALHLRKPERSDIFIFLSDTGTFEYFPSWRLAIDINA